MRLGLLLGVADLGTWLLGRLRFVDPDELDEARIHSRQRRHFPMERPLDRSRELMEPTWGYLADLDAEADRLAAAFVVFVLPRYQHYNPDECPDDWARELFPRTDRYLMEPFRWFEEKAGTADFPVRSLLPAFVEAAEPQTVWRDDPHYNEIGHRIAADAMVEILREEGLLDP